MTTEDFLRRLADRAPVGAAAIGAAAGLPSSELAYAEILRTANEDSPHAVVSNIARCVCEQDAQGLRRYIDSAFAEELFGQTSPSDSAVLSVLSVELEDVVNEDGWGFATAWRPTGADREIVKYVRGGSRSRLIEGPHRVQAHIFHLERRPAGWVLVDLDGPDPAVAEHPDPGAIPFWSPSD